MISIGSCGTGYYVVQDSLESSKRKMSSENPVWLNQKPNQDSQSGAASDSGLSNNELGNNPKPYPKAEPKPKPNMPKPNMPKRNMPKPNMPKPNPYSCANPKPEVTYHSSQHAKIILPKTSLR